jgi:hypothetical protein
VIDPIPIPEHAPLYMTYDWGFGKPFHIGWWWVDGDGRIYLFDEWYGWSGKPNEGLRITDPKVALKVIEREKALGIWNRPITRLAGHDSFAKKPDIKGGGQGKSTAEEFADKGIYLIKGDPDRKLKIRQFHERLRVLPDARPMMVVYRHCRQFIRTIPDLIVDEHNVEDVDTKGEDHCLHGDTLIQTDRGIIPIRDMVGTKGKALTIGGRWVPYQNCRLTRRDAPVVNLEFEDGTHLICTPDHEILNSHGIWKQAIDLSDSACYVSISKGEETCASKLFPTQFKNLMVNASINVAPISKAMAPAFIAKCGNITTVLSRTPFMSITRTMTGLITRLRIWSFNRSQLMQATTPTGQIMPIGFEQCTMGLEGGMEAKTEKNGTRSTLTEIVKLSFRRRFQKSAPTAQKTFLESLGQYAVHASARSGKEDREGLESNKERARFATRFSMLYGHKKSRLVQNLVRQDDDGKTLKVVRVQPSGNSDVYCLTVPSFHCFALGNGVIVSNCYDSAALLCMARPMALELPKKLVNYYDARIDALERGDRGSFEAWAEREQLQTMREMGISTVGAAGIEEAEWPEGYVDQDEVNEDTMPTIREKQW